ncbi:MAG: Translation initiation factor IF-2 [candidate division BRC1 bacterium ADurb.BinA364]|nr:MAG: Translation initiation factor IF-2 [candidate division BRC1 bacterium ADurb.BinA364]
MRPEAAAEAAAQQAGVEIKTYSVIYSLIDEVKSAMIGMLDKRYKEITRGRAEVRQVFRHSKFGNVAGCYVASGQIRKTSKVRLLRDSVIVFEGELANLRRFKDDVAVVEVGLECGIGLQGYQDVKEGDLLEAYELEEVPIHI